MDEQLSGGDYAFLGFVGWGLDTAYAIKKAMSGSISFFWSAAHSQVYQQAARLVRDGYVREREEESGRRRRLLSLTPKGRRALTRWLAEPAAPLELRDEMLVKVFFASQASGPSGTTGVLEQQRALYASVLEEFRAIEGRLVAAGDERSLDGLLTVRLGIRVIAAYLGWFDEAVADLRARRG